MVSTLTLADASVSMLIGWWMALLLVALYIPWGWLVSTVLDKDARYFNLNQRRWNSIQMAAGALGIVAFLLIPIPGVNVVGALIVLISPILVYWKIRNDSVPEVHRFKLSGMGFKDRMEARKRAKASRGALIEFIDVKGRRREAPTKDDALFPVHMAAEDLIVPARTGHASRVEILVTPKGSAITQTVDGIAYKREPLPPDQALAVVDYFKELAGLDVKDRRRRQTADFEMTSPAGRCQLHITTAGSSNGLVTRIDFDLSKQLSIPYDHLGLLQSQMEGLRSMTDPHDRHGIVLIGAPKGQGLTTSTYSILNRHDAYTANIKTLEREILLWLDGVDQVRWDPNNPNVDFATNLQSILRRDPDIVMVDVLQDTESGRVVSEPGMQGPLIYIQQRQANIVDQIREWVKAAGDVKRATKSLRAVINQRLLRKLCPNCRQAYQPTPEQVRKLNLPAGKVHQLYRAGGKVQEKNRIENCPVCGGTGYLGQTGIFEVMVLDDEGRKILAGGDLKAALAHARRNKMIYLQEAALAKVVSGETSIEEVLRVTAPPKSADATKPRTEPTQPQPASS